MVAAFCAYWTVMVLPSGSIYESSASCDLVEINHRHNAETGVLEFTQLICWDWSPEYGRFDAQSWALISDWRRNKDDVVVDVMGGPRILRIRCQYFRETWTRHDPERENTKVFPDKFRRKVW